MHRPLQRVHPVAPGLARGRHHACAELHLLVRIVGVAQRGQHLSVNVRRRVPRVEAEALGEAALDDALELDEL